MKFFFAKTDSLYKIFKSLEKIPAHRNVEIFIDPEHSLFDNEWRGQQIKEIIDKNQINATFSTKNSKNRDYFTSLWLNVSFEKENYIQKTINICYLFFFNIKKFHLHTYESKRYLFVLIFLFEALLILWILRFIISLIIPSANILVQPSENSETIIYNVRYYPYQYKNEVVDTRFLYVPFYTGALDYKYDLTISTANIKHIANPSRGQIKIYNKREHEYNLIKDTQFITDDGLIFRAVSDFVLPAWSEKKPSELIITVQADEYDLQWELIWVRGNVDFKTQMLIKNLDESALTKDIWAESIENFVWWNYESVWTVTQKDIEQLRQSITNQVYDKKMSIVSQNFSVSGAFLLPFETITTTQFNDIQILQSSGDSSPTLKWTAYVTYNYKYVLREDLHQVFMTYLNERHSENNLIVKINQNTLQFLKDSNTTNSDEIKKSGKVYSISTQVDVIQAYDFDTDQKQILSDIKNKTSGMKINDARNFILSSYDEIWSVKISVPLRYDTIPVIKSRIKISYKQPNT